MEITKIPTNYVLVEIDSLIKDKVLLSSGGELLIDPTFEPEKHRCVFGVVKAIPEKLYFNKKDMEESVEFNVDIDLQVGDRVYYNYLQVSSSLSEGRVFDIDGKKHIYVRYDSCFCAFRGDDVVMLNGWMLLEPFGNAEEWESSLVTNYGRRPKPHPLKGKIVHIGSPVKEYLWSKHESDDGLHVGIGDHVMFLPYSNIPLEYGLHESLGKTYYRTQRKELLTKIHLQ